ncbi:MAG TPA: vitamin K epoxide reductase family protein, partial [Solirubrobacteraceae bacterium]|nr:vitamin K epoxide reductase family protein [Solirubrobacteraceae bacterium]
MLRRIMLPLAVAGLAVAAYLSYEHATGGTAVCPTGGGGCGKVQSSPELRLLGVYIPYLALAGYAGVTASLLVRAPVAGLVTAGLAYLGVGMTGYVLYLQAFVIEAWCPWCVFSTALMWTIAALATWCYLRGDTAPAAARRVTVARGRARGR